MRGLKQRRRCAPIAFSRFTQIAGVVEQHKAFTGNSDQVVVGSKGIAANIGKIAAAAERTRSGSSETMQACKELSRLSTELERIHATFFC